MTETSPAAAKSSSNSKLIEERALEVERLAVEQVVAQAAMSNFEFIESQIDKITRKSMLSRLEQWLDAMIKMVAAQILPATNSSKLIFTEDSNTTPLKYSRLITSGHHESPPNSRNQSAMTMHGPGSSGLHFEALNDYMSFRKQQKSQLAVQSKVNLTPAPSTKRGNMFEISDFDAGKALSTFKRKGLSLREHHANRMKLKELKLPEIGKPVKVDPWLEQTLHALANRRLT